MHLVLNMFIFTRTLVTYARTIFKPSYRLSSGAGFRPSLQPSWSPLIFPFLFAVEELYDTRYQSGSFSLINVGGGFHCLRSFFFYFFFSFWADGFILKHGWPRPVSSRSAKQPGWRSPFIVTIVSVPFVGATSLVLRRQVSQILHVLHAA